MIEESNMKPAQRFTVLLIGSKLLKILLSADSLQTSTLLETTFSSETGSHLLFFRLLGLLSEEKEKGLESFWMLPKNKNK